MEQFLFFSSQFSIRDKFSGKAKMQVETRQININAQMIETSQTNIVSLKLQQIAFQTKSEDEGDNLENSKSENSQNQQRPLKSPNEEVTENSDQTHSPQSDSEHDSCFRFLSLKNIKSKEEIQLQSKQNQEILFNLSSNIDDLFKKISCLTQEINTELEPRQLKEKSVSNIEDQKSCKEKVAKFNSPKKSEKQVPKMRSSPLIQFSQVVKQKQDKQIQDKQQYKRSYNPIFFQSSKKHAPQYSINMKLFQTGKSLGCGKFGQVVQCRNPKTNSVYALKKIFKSVIEEYSMQDQLLTEIQILTQIDHPNIVRAYEAFTDDYHIFILMEYINGCLLTKKFKASEKQVKIIIRQVLQALKYLHEKKIAHRDIKPENIILTAENVVKICDFGWASQSGDNMNILCGTLDYVSPEMVNQSSYSQKVDLWNVGVLTYELIHGYPPFKGSSKSKIFEKVKNLEFSYTDQVQVSAQCRSFIEGFLKIQTERTTIQDALMHEFLLNQTNQIAEQSQITPGLIEQVDELFKAINQ